MFSLLLHVKIIKTVGHEGTSSHLHLGYFRTLFKEGRQELLSNVQVIFVIIHNMKNTVIVVLNVRVK